MATVILRRSANDSPSPEAELVASLRAAVIHRSDRTILVDLGDETKVDELRGKLPGWVVSLQGPKIQVPDTRLRIRSPQ